MTGTKIINIDGKYKLDDSLKTRDFRQIILIKDKQNQYKNYLINNRLGDNDESLVNFIDKNIIITPWILKYRHHQKCIADKDNWKEHSSSSCIII